MPFRSSAPIRKGDFFDSKRREVLIRCVLSTSMKLTRSYDQRSGKKEGGPIGLGISNASKGGFKASGLQVE